MLIVISQFCINEIVFQGGENQAKKVNFGKSVHPSIQ